MLWMEPEEEICRWASVKCLHMLAQQWVPVRGEAWPLGAESVLIPLGRPLMAARIRGRDESADRSVCLCPVNSPSAPQFSLEGLAADGMQEWSGTHSSFLFGGSKTCFASLQLCCGTFSIRSLHTNVQLIWKELTKMPQEVVALFLFFLSLANSPHFAGKLPIQSCPDSTFCFLSCQSLLPHFF